MTIALLILIDLGIKNDLIREARKLERTIADANLESLRRATGYINSVPHPLYSNISDDLHADVEDPGDTEMEVESLFEESDEIPSNEIVRKVERDSRGRYRKLSEGNNGV